jgi:hypothetical protein
LSAGIENPLMSSLAPRLRGQVKTERGAQSLAH